MIKRLSILDLSTVSSGSDSQQALQNTIELARFADKRGFTRHWLAEHHNMPGIASPSPAIMAGQLARETKNIRVGSGGIMLPNHSPLKVAEDFKLLEALFPGRIDLGIGRAPGSDRLTAVALRRTENLSAGNDLEGMLAELKGFASGSFPEGHPFKAVTAVPVGVNLPPVWILGSSFYSAELAASLGLGYVFAHHINSNDAIRAVEIYKKNFKPSAEVTKPLIILAVSVICADTDEEAEFLAGSMNLSMIRLSQGRPGLTATPEEARDYPYSPYEKEFIFSLRNRRITGTPATVRKKLDALAEITGAEEFMILTITHSQEKRLHSYDLLVMEFITDHDLRDLAD